MTFSRNQRTQFRLRHNLDYVAELAALIDENTVINKMRTLKFIEKDFLKIN